MKPKTLAPFFSDVQNHFQPTIDLFIGGKCWPAAVENWVNRGRGSTLALDIGQDPTDLLWPVQDRIVICHCVDHRLWRYKRLEKALRRDGAYVVVGCIGDEFFVAPEQCGEEGSSC